MDKFTLQDYKNLAYETRYGISIGIAITAGLILGGLIF